LKLIRTGDGYALPQQDGHPTACYEKQLIPRTNITKAYTYISANGREKMSNHHGDAFNIRGRKGRRVDVGGMGWE
jgi:hypothetical protein